MWTSNQRSFLPMVVFFTRASRWKADDIRYVSQNLILSFGRMLYIRVSSLILTLSQQALIKFRNSPMYLKYFFKICPESHDIIYNWILFINAYKYIQNPISLSKNY